MSESEADKPGIRNRQETLAVGIVADDLSSGELARVVLRARSHNYPVYVTCTGGAIGIPELEDLAGVTVVPGEATTGVSSKEAAKQRLAGAARSASAAGVVVVDDGSLPIDFESAHQAVLNEGTFVTPAVSLSSGDHVRIMVAIPAYNESETIGDVVAGVSDVVDEVVVVDDGSDDSTELVAREAGATVVAHAQNRGYGGALQTAFRTAHRHRADCLVVIDGDNQHDVTDVPELAGLVTDGDVNVAIGSRFVDGADCDIPFYRQAGLGVINLLTNVSMGSLRPMSWISDTQSGFRAYDEDAIAELAEADIGSDMDASLNILYHLRSEDFEIKEVPTVVDYDVESSHSQYPVSHGLRLVRTILQTVERDHPILFLGVPGFLFTLAGVLVSYLTINNYLSTGTFSIGLGLVSAFLTLLGVFAAFTAIVLHSLQAHLSDQ